MLVLTVRDGSTRVVHRRVEGFVCLHPIQGDEAWLAWADERAQTVVVASPHGDTLSRVAAGETATVAGLTLTVHASQSDETDRIEVSPRRAPTLTLCLADGRKLGLSSRTVVLGSHPDCDLVLADPTVSARHCEVLPHRGGWVARDLGSTNGLWLAGSRVPAAALTPGVSLTFGRTRVLCSIAEPNPSASHDGPGTIVGRSHPMQALRAAIERYAPAPYTVLIEGESGSGKELVAREIHARSKRKGGPLVAINCGAVAPTLIESELFGHERGAFTGASGRRRGVFEEANGGTLFLDEVGELPLAVQPALLRVLETGEFRRVGGEGAVKTSVRVVAATLRDLEARVREGSFREDLFFRLADFRISVPALRARRGDIPLLAEHILTRIEADTGLSRRLEDRALGVLMANEWPGNVRELASVLKRAVFLADGERIGPEHLHLAPRRPTSAAGAPGATEEKTRAPKKGPRRDPWPEGMSREDLPALFAWCEGNTSRASRMLGMARSTFRERLGRIERSGGGVEVIDRDPRRTNIATRR